MRDKNTVTAVARVRGELQPYWNAFSRVHELTFPAANVVFDVVHELDQVPDGYVIVWADGVVHAEPGVLWTKELAFLRATAANVNAKVIFYTLRETRNES